MDLTLNAVKETDKLFVLVCLDTLVPHPPVDPNVLQAMNVHKMKHVAIRNAKILVPELVELMQNVKSLITTQYAVVLRARLVIHLLDANIKLFNRLQQTHVNRLLAGRMQFVELLAIKHLVRVCLK